MQVQHYRDAGAFDALRAEWNKLVFTSSANEVFLTIQWQEAWWRHLGEGELWVTAVRDPAGMLLAIFPCHVLEADGRRILRFIGCVEVTDYLDLILAKGHEETLLPLFVESLLGPAAPAWDAVELCNIPQASMTLRLLPELARAAGLAVEVRQRDVCPVIPLPASWEAYLMMLDKKQRHEIRRKLRRAQSEAALEWYIVGPEHDFERELDIFLELHRKSRPDKHAFMTPRTEAFFRAMARALFDAGWLQLSHLVLDGRHEASMLSFDYDNAILLYNSGFDPEGHPHLSPGNVLISLCIQHAIELGRREFDFLRGDEEYKYRFGARDTYVYQIEMERH